MDENNTISSFRVLYATGLTEGQRRNIERELYRRAIIDPEIARDMNEQDMDAEFEALHDNILKSGKKQMQRLLRDIILNYYYTF